MTEIVETPVLIVGGGPVGLAMAIELGWRGIRCVLVERGNGEIEHPRTGLIAVRTMEVFRRWGFAERVRRCGFPEDYRLSMVFCTSLAGFLLGREDYPSMRDAPTPPQTPEKKQRCPQLWMQPILTAQAAEDPCVRLRFEHAFEGFRDLGHAVVSTVTDLRSRKTLAVRSRYVIACDGASSGARSALGIAMQGRLLGYSVNVLLRIPDLVRYHDKGEAERYLFVGPQGTWGNLTVVDGREIWRLTILGSATKLDVAGLDVPAQVRAALGRDDVPFEILSVLPWRRSELLAERFSSGSVLLAGDALHTMSPTGGMGMNTGMQEVSDLGWKLDAMIAGWGGPGLLDSYTAERRPVARRNIDFSTQNFRAWQAAPEAMAICDDTPEGLRVRGEIGHRLREATRVEWESLGLQIGYRYDGSPLIVPDGTPAPADDYSIYTQTARPGARAPHAWLADGRSTLDLFGRGFVLLAFPGAVTAEAERLLAALRSRSIPVSSQAIDRLEIADLYANKLALVRPDGHVAWRGDKAAEAGRIAATVSGHATGTEIGAMD